MNIEVNEKMIAIHEKMMTDQQKLLDDIKLNLHDLESLYGELNLFKDEVMYRFYHQSFKVFRYQSLAKWTIEVLSKINPNLNKWFLEIVEKGTGKEFDLKMNDNWLKETAPIVEAFWHCHYFIHAIISCGQRLKVVPELLDSEWAAILYLYNSR